MWHGSIGAGDDEDSSVHLSSSGDHVLDVISVPRAIHVGIVSVLRLVLYSSGVDGDTTGSFLRRGVDFVVLFGDSAAGGG